MSDFYVYELIDPRDNAVFYVGKGKGGRVSLHAKMARRGRIGNAEKHRRIAEIHAAGLEVVENIVSRHANEDDAYAAERVRIAALKGSLTNIVGGVVTNAGAAREMAARLLSRLKTFDQWVAGMSPAQLSSAARLGGPASLYHAARDELEAAVAG